MTNKTIKLTVQKRDLTGRKVKKLRREGIVPANIFGKDVKSQAIQISERDFLKAYKEAGETSIIELSVEGSKSTNPVLVSDLQVHPVSGEVVHIDFHQVDLKQEVTATVPIELTGEAPAVKEKGGVLFSPISDLEITALPTEIPSSIEIDISSMQEIGDTLTLGDIKLDTSKIEFSISSDEPLVIIQEPKAEEEPEPATEEADESEEGAEDATEKKSEENPSEEDKKEE